MKWFAIILAVCVVAFGVCAQPNAEADEIDEVRVYADFGFTNVVPGSRHGPVRVWVQAQSDDISGHIEFTHTGENGTVGRIVAPVDVAAGGLTSVSIVAPISVWTESIVVTLRSSSGARLAEVNYASLPDSSELQITPPLLASQEILLSATSRCSTVHIAEKLVELSITESENLTVAEKGGISGLAQWQRQMFVFSNCVGASEQAEKLPLSQMAYEGVLAVVVDSTTARDADPRAIAALHRWVLGGGRLVVLADMPGELWRRWLPPTVPAGSISLGNQQQIDIPQQLAEFTDQPMSRTLTARPIRLALPAIDAGWQSRWTIGDDALLAEGPAGFGWVTVVSVHPNTVAPMGLATSSRVWADALRAACDAVYMKDSSARAIQVGSRGWRNHGFTKEVPVYVFDAISTAAPIGNAAIVLVAAVTVSLALALGPVDFLILKFLKLRHLAWLSALLWIGLASIFGIVMPDRLRAGPSSIARLSVVDQLVVNEALTGGASHPQNAAIAQLPAELRAWRLGFTNIFSGSRGTIAVDAPGSGAHWSEYSEFGSAGVVSRPLTVVQRPRSGGLEAIRSSAPLAIRPGVWTSKVYTDTGPVRSGLDVSLAPTERGWHVTILGLGAPSRILAGQLRVGQRYYSIKPRSAVIGGEPVSIDLDNDFATDGPLGNYSEFDDADNARRYIHSMYYNRTLGEIRPYMLQSLPGPTERSPACERLLQTGRYAMLELFVTDQPLDVAMSAGDLVTQQSTMYRLMIPIEGDPFGD